MLAHWPRERRGGRHPARLDRVPHLARHVGARGARIVARALDHRQDTRWIGGIAQQEIDDALRGIIIAMRLPEREILPRRSEEHTSELQSLMRISYAVFCLTKKKKTQDE